MLCQPRNDLTEARKKLGKTIIMTIGIENISTRSSREIIKRFSIKKLQ